MNQSLVKKIIEKEISGFSSKLTAQHIEILHKAINSEVNKYLTDEQFLKLSPNQQQFVLGNMARWTTVEAIKLFKTKIPSRFYSYILEILVEGIFKVVMICLEAQFDKEERSKLIKEEAHVSLLFAVSLLKDDDKIDDSIYNNATMILDK